MIKKIASFVAAVAVLLIPAAASAHVVVMPSTANVGETVTFNVSVPNEKDSAVTNLKLTMPAGLQEVTPTVKAGWTVTTITTGTGDDADVTAINWAGGSIPVGFNDTFTFRAQVPAKSTDLDWKAYQTYADGSVVHWDQKPAGSDDSSGDAGPYSVTKVSNDLQTPVATTKSTNANVALTVSLIAIVLSIATLLFRKK